MAQTYFPFDSGQGANVSELQWTKMAQHWLETGVIKGDLNELFVYADSTGMQVKVNSGVAWIKGHYYESDAEVVIPISNADSTNPRIDRIVIRLDWTENTVELAVIQGMPALSPTPPAFTQNSSRWEIPLAQIRINANSLTITAANITDERSFANSRSAIGLTSNTINQSVPTGSYFQPMMTVQEDVLGEFTGYDITLKESGWYAVTMLCTWDLKAGTIVRSHLLRNGVFWEDITSWLHMSGDATGTRQAGSVCGYFNKGDKLRFEVNQIGGANAATLRLVNGRVVRVG